MKTNADRQAKQQQFRDEYIKEFVSNALNQDIELRIRFAQYFSQVSAEAYRKDWLKYHTDLQSTRKEIRDNIDKMEAHLLDTKAPSEIERERLQRHLNWAYAEVGYVQRNRSATANPRTPEGSSLAPKEVSPLPETTVLSLGRFQILCGI